MSPLPACTVMYYGLTSMFLTSYHFHSFRSQMFLLVGDWYPYFSFDVMSLTLLCHFHLEFVFLCQILWNPREVKLCSLMSSSCAHRSHNILICLWCRFLGKQPNHYFIASLLPKNNSQRNYHPETTMILCFQINRELSLLNDWSWIELFWKKQKTQQLPFWKKHSIRTTTQTQKSVIRSNCQFPSQFSQRHFVIKLHAACFSLMHIIQLHGSSRCVNWLDMKQAIWRRNICFSCEKKQQEKL